MKKSIKVISKIGSIVGLILALTSCTKWVAGSHDEAGLKDAKDRWGVPRMRPVVWGFTGIERDCKEDCTQEEKK